MGRHWKPKYHDYYFSINPYGECVDMFCENDWLDMNLYKIGNCYPKPEEAELNRDKWIKFYISDSVLKT